MRKVRREVGTEETRDRSRASAGSRRGEWVGDTDACEGFSASLDPVILPGSLREEPSAR